MVDCRKDGLKVYYTLSGDDIIGLLDALRGVAERHVADVDRLINTYFNGERQAGTPAPPGTALQGTGQRGRAGC